MNNTFKDASWYDEQYQTETSTYHKAYINPSEYLKAEAEANCAYAVSLSEAYLQPHRGSKVLEVGCGVGFHVRAWRERGYQAKGVDFSHEAVKHAGDKDITQVDAKRLPFQFREFDTIYTNQFFEHIPEESEAEVMAEFVRVGRKQIHFIADRVGSDPSHINIKTPAEWVAGFESVIPKGYMAIAIPILNAPDTPVIVIAQRHRLMRDLIFHKYKTEMRQT